MLGALSGIGYGYGYYGYRIPRQSAGVLQGVSEPAAVSGTAGLSHAAGVAATGSIAGIAGGRVTAIPAAQPEMPVQPIPAVPSVSLDTPLDKASLLRRLETDPAAMAVRSRIRYLEGGNTASTENGQVPQTGVQANQNVPIPQETAPGNHSAIFLEDAEKADKNGEMIPGISENTQAAGLNGAEEAKGASKSKSAQDVIEEAECETCEKRKYQDGSDDPGVSFKTPAHVSPEMAASAVRGHENEHVVREQAKAELENRKVVSQSVTYHTAICPECGRTYVSGGTTRTVTAARNDPYQQQQEEENPAVSGFAELLGAEPEN